MSKKKDGDTVKVRNGTNFDLIIPRHINDQVMYWVNKSTKEVSWFGTLDFDKELQRFTVKKVYLLKQEVTGSTTDINEDAMAELMWQVHKEDPMSELRWWGHSHVDMPVFWSGEDKNTIRQLGYNGWILATVFNKKHERRTAFCAPTEVLGNEHEIFVDEIPTSVQYTLDESQEQIWASEYEQLVLEKKPPEPAKPAARRGSSYTPSKKGGKPSKREMVLAGYPVSGQGAVGYFPKGKSPTAWSGLFDANGGRLYPDDRTHEEKRGNQRPWIHGFLAAESYWIYGHYFGDPIQVTMSFSHDPNFRAEPVILVSDEDMTELVNKKNGERMHFKLDETIDLSEEEEMEQQELLDLPPTCQWTPEDIRLAKQYYNFECTEDAIEYLDRQYAASLPF
jgi:hypothetical protein